MDSIKGLKEYVRHPFYREALGLPEEVTERYEMLAQGEYNRNYVFTHPVTGKKLVLRVNCGSQMHLRHQEEHRSHFMLMAVWSIWTMVLWSWNFCLEQLWIITKGWAVQQNVLQIFTV